MYKKGFTLIELLVVISIIGLLSSIVLASLKSARDKAQVAAGQRFSTHMHRALAAHSVGSWTFESVNGGITADSSGYNKNLSVHNATVVDGVIGNALRFTGLSTSYAQTTSPVTFTSNKWTIAAWVKPSTTSGGIFLTVQSLPYLRFTDSSFYWSWSDGTQERYEEPVNRKLDQWYHVAMASTGTEIAMYVNGQEVQRISSVSVTPPGGTIYVGRFNSGFAIDADIDEVHVFNDVLVASEIQKMYAKGLPKYLAGI